MSNMNNLAHPYAEAIFEYAKANNSIDEWLDYLSNLAQIAKNKEFNNLITNPKISKEEVIRVLVELLHNSSQAVERLLVVLQENDRLQILADISELLEKLVAKERNTANAVIYSAFAMNKEDQEQFQQLLSKKFAKLVSAKVEIKPELIGGVKILINDLVIDASVKGSLDNMAANLYK